MRWNGLTRTHPSFNPRDKGNLSIRQAYRGLHQLLENPFERIGAELVEIEDGSLRRGRDQPRSLRHGAQVEEAGKKPKETGARSMYCLS